MIRYEIKKLLASKLTVAIIIIGLIVNAYVIMDSPNKVRRYYTDIEAYNKLYEYLEGTVTEDKRQQVVEKYNELHMKLMTQTFSNEYDSSLYTGYEYREYALYKEMYDKYQYISNYSGTLEGYKSYCKDNYEFYEDESISNYYKTIYDTYNQRSIEHFYKTKNYKYLLDYEFSNLCIIICLILALSGCYCAEREKHMSQIILNCRYGRTKIFFEKLSAGIIVSVAIGMMYIVEDVVCFIDVYGLDHMTEPAYSIEELQYCIYDISIGQYICLIETVRLIGVVMVGILVMCASAFVDNQLMASATSIGMVVPFIIVNGQDVPFNILRLAHITDDLSSINVKALFGQYITYMDYTLVTCIGLCVVLLVVAYLIETKSALFFGRERC